MLKLFDWISFSLDAPNKNIQRQMGRNELHYDRVMTILRYLKGTNCRNKIKINTVISKVNINYILNLYELICKYNIERWKIFRFLPSRGNALEYREKYYISEKIFLDKISEINLCNIGNRMKISINGYNNFDNSYITISSEGKLIVYKKNEYKSCVNLLNEDVDRILEYINIEEHKKNRSDFLYVR